MTGTFSFNRRYCADTLRVDPTVQYALLVTTLMGSENDSMNRVTTSDRARQEYAPTFAGCRDHCRELAWLLDASHGANVSRHSIH
mgnify:CR=1 FL=1